MTAPAAASRADADQLSTHQLDRIRACLFADLDTQRRNVAELQLTADSLMGQTDSDSLLERELAESRAAHALEVVAEIQQALSRIDQGIYGSCARCGARIAAARLEALPHTRFCVDCPTAAPRLIG
jgi:DnaK suppressor protein